MTAATVPPALVNIAVRNHSFYETFLTEPNFFALAIVTTVAIQRQRVGPRVRHAFGVLGVGVPRHDFFGAATPARSRRRSGVLVVRGVSTAFAKKGLQRVAYQTNIRTKRGPLMDQRMWQPDSISKRLLVVAVVFATLQAGYAQSQTQQGTNASFSELRSQAERGDAVAEYKLAKTYLAKTSLGHDPSNEDYQSALRWLRAAAAQNNASAEFLLGYMYEHGQGVPRDYAQAAENYRAAALQGHSTAENNLASLHQHGQGVAKNMREAFDWYLASAQHGNPTGQCNLATLYYLGSGTSRDYQESAKWFRAAAESGSPEAQNNLAVFYMKGMGVAIDPVEAVRWMRLAAEQGLPGAETNLAYLYEQGRGLPLDYVAAYTWYSRAIAAGDSSGAEHRKQVSQLLTRKQIAEAAATLSTSNVPSRPAAGSVGTFSLMPNH